MKSIRAVLSLLLVCCTVPFGVAAQAPANGVIVPGQSVAGLKLGSTFSEFEKVFPKHPGIDEDSSDNLQDGCPERSYHWLDIDRNANGIYAYFKNGKLYQLSVHTPRFALEGGLHLDSRTDDAKHAYPDGLEYVLLGSGSAVVGGRDLLYWVDQADGIAFEFYWNGRKHQRLVSGIDIFAKGSDYLPSGCISPPQQWQKLKQTLR